MAVTAKLIIQREIEQISSESTQATLKRKKLKNGRMLSVDEARSVRKAAKGDSKKLSHLNSIMRLPFSDSVKRKSGKTKFNLINFLTSK